MAISKLDNTANVEFEGSPVPSNTVTTLLTLEPTIVKAADLSTAFIGDDVVYTITISNLGGTDLTDLPFSDALPAGCTYNTGSFKVDTVTQTPTVAGDTISYTIPSIAALTGVSVIEFSVLVTG